MATARSHAAFVASLLLALAGCSGSRGGEETALAPSKYPVAIEPSRVGSYPAFVKSGAGYFYDDVLEYRVWICEQAADDHFFAFATFEEASEFAAATPDAEEPLVLVRQLEHVNEPEPGKFEHVRGERLTEWRVEWLAGNQRAADSIPRYLAGEGRADAGQAVSATLELDHVFVLVEPGAEVEAALLEEAGITVSGEVTEHAGQGTASRSALFGGAYLELLWIDGRSALAPGKESVVERLRAGACAGAGPSPFGVGLRRAASAPDAPPFPTTPYRAPWMSEYEPPIELIDVSGDRGAVFLFIVPRYIAMPSWQGAVRAEAPDRFDHRLGVKRLTGVRVHTAGRPAAAADLAGVPGMEFAEAESCLLELTFDGGASGASHDLRPGLPIVIRR